MSQLIKAIILPATELQVVANDNAFRCSGGPTKVRPKYGDTIWVADDTGNVAGHAKWVDCKRTQSGDLEWSLKSFAPVSQMKIDRRVIAEKIKGGERLVRLPGNCLINQASTICLAFERNGKRSSESAASTDTWSEPKRPSIAEASDHSRQSSAASISAAPADLPPGLKCAVPCPRFCCDWDCYLVDGHGGRHQCGRCGYLWEPATGLPPDYEDDKRDKDKEETSGPQASVSEPKRPSIAEASDHSESLSENVDLSTMHVEPVVAEANDISTSASQQGECPILHVESVVADAKVTLLQYYK